jgi:membrane protein implicated in regulation of membrane protease activity
MEWSAATLWWLLAGVLVAAELATGSFYLLMLALGAAAGALAAHSGLGATAQVALAAVLGGGATAGWHFKRYSRPQSAPSPSNRDMLLDVGQTVHVPAWEQGRLTHVHYRGASWAARYEGPGEPAPGEHIIVSVHGSELHLAPAAAR